MSPADFDKATATAGGVSSLAKTLGASPQTLIHWRTRGVPANKCKAFEAATGVSVMLLRDDWADYWPEAHRLNSSAIASN